jgi:hypothetical protein
VNHLRVAFLVDITRIDEIVYSPTEVLIDAGRIDCVQC